VKTTEADPTLIVTVFDPFTVPKVQLASAALPAPSVVNVAELIEPLPVMPTAIAAPGAGLSKASVTNTLGGGLTA
jgi:hypothetical protein